MDRHLFDQIFDQEWSMAGLISGDEIDKDDVRYVCQKTIKRYVKESGLEQEKSAKKKTEA